MNWLRTTKVFAQFKLGDWVTLLLGAVGIYWLASLPWQNGIAEQVVIRSGGKIYTSAPLSRNQIITVPGALGVTQVIVHNLQARIAADPGLRQYCVQQGWLKQAGEIALCLPNQVSIELRGRNSTYDSLNY